MMRSVKIVFLLLCCALGFRASATHIYGADFTYTHVTGLQYNISLVIYGDCGGSAISNLYGATPQVEIYNGSTLVTTISLTQQGPSTGVEVTPVCPSELSNTNCVSATGTVPGVKKFVYASNYTLSGTSGGWRFRFTGNLNSSATGSAGRSNSITNITGGTTMALESTLNNISGPNSSPTYTTIPTPFFCINAPANYNPGNVDPNNDNLSYSLVAGLSGAGGTVVYTTPYTATAPLACSTGAFSYSSTTGQLSFTPNLVQRSLVVNTVSEYRGTTLVGTSMREMTFVVLNSCSNNAPVGVMSNASAGNVSTSGTVLTVCKFGGTLTFNIDPTDLESGVINMSASGLPAGASLTITNNTSTAPTSVFSWNLATVAPGTYNFYITYSDDGCPLSSRQTSVYTIVVLPQPPIGFSLLTPATCIKKATFNINPSNPTLPWFANVIQGSTVLHSFGPLITGQLDSLAPGTYSIRVTDGNTCVKDTSITLMPPPVIVPSVAITQPSCYGSSNGSITITAGGGTTPFTYANGSGSYSSSNVFSSLAAGTYTLHIKDGFNCIKDTTVVVDQPAQIQLALQSAKPRCNFYNSGAVIVTASNGFAPYTYALGTGSFSSTNTYTALSSGTYLFRAKDDKGCIRDSLFLLQDSIVVHATAVVTNVLCYGASTGAVAITGNGGTSPYIYRLGTGTLTSNNNFTSLPSANHIFRVQDADNCYLDTSINITQPTRITSAAVITDVTCKGLTNGIATLSSITGGVLPYSTAIGSGSFGVPSLPFSGLAAGSYTIHIKDGNSCIKDTVITIAEPAKLNFSNIAITEPICNNEATGTIAVTGTGGTMPYTYAINNSSFSSGSVFNSIAANTYTLHIKDAKSCITDSIVTVQQPTRIVPSLAVKRSTCSPLNDGKVTVAVSGGVPAYQYALGSGSYSNVATYTPLAAGAYTFHIKDTRGCIKDTSINIADSITVTALYTIDHVKCFTENSGSIAVTPTAGTSPFTFSTNANPYQTSGSFNNLIAAAYTVRIKDVLGCTKDTVINITEPTQLFPNVSITRPSCYGFQNGSVNIFGSGGTPPYSYAYNANNYQTSTGFTGLGVGSYTFHVKDAKNCIHDTLIVITQPDPLKYDSLKLADVLCYGTSTGQISIFASGGTQPYQYTADGGSFGTLPTITNLAVGTHVVKLKDNNGCTKDTVVSLKQPTKLVMNKPDITYPTCDGFNDASVSLYGLGGMLPYTYAMDTSGFSSSNSFRGLKQGTYKFFLRDLNNCVVDTTLTLNGYPPISIKDLETTDVSCNGLADGKISVTAAGGVPAFRYQLNSLPIAADSSFTGLKAGIYKIRVIDSKDCVKDTIAEIIQPEKLSVTTTTIPNDCEDLDNGGLVKADVKGGTFPYNYEWSHPNITGPEARGLPNGRFKVLVADANNCTDSATDEVVYSNCCKVFIPNAFSPNGDGLNDLAKVLYKGDLKLYTFMIYNRFGQRMFETNNINEGWDGRYKGKMQDLDTYSYYVKGLCGNEGKEVVEFKGTVMLIR